MPEEAFKIHGFSEEFLSNQPTFDQIVEEFLNFIKGKKLIIHNADFDLSFLNGELGLVKKKSIDKTLVIDSLEVARNKFPGTSNSLDSLCKRFNIDISRRVKHNALLDCELLREVYINLLDVKEPKLNLSSQSRDVLLMKKNMNQKIYSKVFKVEIKKHKGIFEVRSSQKNFY